ncbi:glucuronate isomerase [Enterovibrio sp. ZSDZ35]|uniref:Uronate isomerase n=1 Tax=Enterovibrio qingdaonensis TaxID=2899818 RepID=A0ABT5QIB9_9GAMM|nr:glucuronate isomerase [Enterovibrio sp. ZSDZ35]MDD1780604.1 glucuronate isomerase [Enterovibrio sp. ZSDZ35]
MNHFMSEDFLLLNETARFLYHEHAAKQPIYDFHCHLNPAEIANNRQFDNITQLWLERDHYKWRGMRAAGIEERLITGDADDYEKFQAWAKTVPMTMGNPLYHWTHLELRRPFGITGKLLSPKTAEVIWSECNEKLASSGFSARGIMQQMNVKFVGTTDDPIDSLEHHAAINADSEFDIDVRPSWRPDNVIHIERDNFADYLQALEQASDVAICTFSDLVIALSSRLTHFDRLGCRAADHGLDTIRYAEIPSVQTLDKILSDRLNGLILDDIQVAQFSTAIQVWLGEQYHRLGWVMQLHIGAQRNNSTRMFRLLGPDTGFDSIGDRNIGWPLARLLDEMDKSDKLPKTVLYCLNPADNEVLATMMGNFQSGGIQGKVQFGSAWWFNDQKDGMTRQLTQLAQLGLLSQFIGMLTDSRCFLSYTRHEYFRRILCQMIGRWVEEGEIPNDMSMLAPMIEDICFGNAKRYFDATES